MKLSISVAWLKELPWFVLFNLSVLILCQCRLCPKSFDLLAQAIVMMPKLHSLDVSFTSTDTVKLYLSLSYVQQIIEDNLVRRPLHNRNLPEVKQGPILTFHVSCAEIAPDHNRPGPQLKVKRAWSLPCLSEYSPSQIPGMDLSRNHSASFY